jgi:hypothetical protein
LKICCWCTWWVLGRKRKAGFTEIFHVLL